MSRELTPLYIADLSSFSKGLRKSLGGENLPTHAQFMNLVAKAAGYKNTQHLKSEQPSPDRKTPIAAQRARRFMDADGRMTGWPSRTKVQEFCLWAVWIYLPPKQEMTEKEVNQVLIERSTFGDHVQIRRSLIDVGLLKREVDGTQYRRIERKPNDEIREFLRDALKR